MQMKLKEEGGEEGEANSLVRTLSYFIYMGNSIKLGSLTHVFLKGVYIPANYHNSPSYGHRSLLKGLKR